MTERSTSLDPWSTFLAGKQFRCCNHFTCELLMEFDDHEIVRFISIARYP
jgi:hypothetical protein